MQKPVKVGIIGEYDRQKTSHPAIIQAVGHASDLLAIESGITWISTPSCLTEEGLARLADFDCVWASSGSPYLSTEGMLKGIRRARELGKPFLGT
jgi:CTP synthase (UTP-ammonia lyase)